MVLKIARFVLVSCQISVFFPPTPSEKTVSRSKTGLADVFDGLLSIYKY